MCSSVKTFNIQASASSTPGLPPPGSSGFVDLLNGPQDMGWCFGYTCQERLSTFYSLVAPGRVYEMHFTGTPPQHLRFHFLNAEPDMVRASGRWRKRLYWWDAHTWAMEGDRLRCRWRQRIYRAVVR